MSSTACVFVCFKAWPGKFAEAKGKKSELQYPEIQWNNNKLNYTQDFIFPSQLAGDDNNGDNNTYLYFIQNDINEAGDTKTRA